jgi:mono/diheme cytochrome c family protein
MPPPRSLREEPEISGQAGQVESSRGTGGMGGMGGMMRRIYPAIRSNRENLLALMNEPFELTGSDLYRLNCQSCHGPKGEGSPPEIKSLIGPVQGTSSTFLAERMKKIGRTISPEMAKQLTAGADSSFRARLQHGGEHMPPFRHLRGDEIDALLQYLQKLAVVARPNQKPMLVPQSVARVGEHLVKGTCHTCHDATGPGGGRMAMMSGTVPSLASMPEEQSIQEVVRQVRQGSSPMMSMMGGPEMPAFPYITGDEAAAAYLYLLEYPPVAGP